jgi:hypothetical protein
VREEAGSARRARAKRRSRAVQYSIPNGPGPKSGTRHDPKKHDPSPALGTIDSA